MKFSRRLVALAIASSSALAALSGCSTADSHPPIIGDCSGNLCPPTQGQGISSGSSGGVDSGVDSGGGGTSDSGGIIDDSGTDADTDGSPTDSGGD